MKSRTDWWRPLGGLDECGRLSAIVTARLCDALQYASTGIRGPLLNCMADNRRLSRTHKYMQSSTSSKPLFKKLPSPRRTEWHACHLSLPLSEPGPSTGVIWWRHAPRASLRHHVTPHWAWLRPGSWSGLGAASAVRCCKWLSELTDRSPSQSPLPSFYRVSVLIWYLFVRCVFMLFGYIRYLRESLHSLLILLLLWTVAHLFRGNFSLNFLPSVPFFFTWEDTGDFRVFQVSETQVVSN